MKILIVEDTPYKRQTVEAILKKHGLTEYDTAEYGIDAFMLVEKYQYQLIILDLGFSISEVGKYDSKQGLILLENIQFFCRRKKIQMPKVIVFSETYLREAELEENSLEQAENSVQLQDLISKYLAEIKNEKKVLIVEDEEGKQIKIKRVLEELNIKNYIIATYAEKAKEECFNNFDVDVIIYDMQFPWKKDEAVDGEAGIKLLEELEKEYESNQKKMPQVVVYSSADIEEIWRKQGKVTPEWFVAQTIFPSILSAILKSIV